MGSLMPVSGANPQTALTALRANRTSGTANLLPAAMNGVSGSSALGGFNAMQGLGMPQAIMMLLAMLAMMMTQLFSGLKGSLGTISSNLGGPSSSSSSGDGQSTDGGGAVNGTEENGDNTSSPTGSSTAGGTTNSTTSSALGGYQPKVVDKTAGISNYSNRNVKPGQKPVFVIHDTEGTAESAVNWFGNPSSQASSHSVIGRDGTIFQTVPPDKAAWAAGESSYKGQSGVNNFGYQVELELMPNQNGYTDEQYKALAYEAVKSGAALEDVTTHEKVAKAVGRTDRVDPRGFDWAKFQQYYSDIKAQNPGRYNLGFA